MTTITTTIIMMIISNNNDDDDDNNKDNNYYLSIKVELNWFIVFKSSLLLVFCTLRF